MKKQAIKLIPYSDGAPPLTTNGSKITLNASCGRPGPLSLICKTISGLVAAFWLTRGCDLKPQAAPTDAGSGQVALRVQADAQRPNIAQHCNSFGTKYVMRFTVSDGRITKLVFTTST